MKITMLGTGYVGLVSGVCFSDFGHDVVCVDKLPEKIAMLERGEAPIYEPDPEEPVEGDARVASPGPRGLRNRSRSDHLIRWIE